MQTLTNDRDGIFGPADSPMCPVATDPQSLDRTLTEIRSGRRLEKIVTSIENFLHNQILRLDKALDEFRLAQNNEKILQKILKDFETEKLQWDEARNSEILRLSDASEKLIEGWQQLEDERRNWLDERDRYFVPTSR